MADLVGQQFGNYRLQRLLGEGGFAQVYLGEHIHLGSLAAIKVLRNRLDQEDQEHFRLEARTLVHLKHPNIVRLLDFGIEGNMPFLVMDYAPGGTLRQRHPRGQPLPLATILPYVWQAADALQFAHEQKLIHRDIKPENMLIGERGEVLLSDFGIATVAQSSRYQSAQEVAGTAAYMAPEQFQGKPRPASDQYALGIVVYEWLTGTRPFHGSFLEISGQHLHMPLPPLHEKLPGISPAIEQAVLMALEKDPQQRFANVQAFANALGQASLYNHPMPINAAPPPFRQSTPLPPTLPPTTVSGGLTMPAAAPTIPFLAPSKRRGTWALLSALLVLPLMVLLGAVLVLVINHRQLLTSSCKNTQVNAPTPLNVLFADDFTQDTHLDTNCWIVNGPVVRAAQTNFDSPPATIVQPVLNFSATQGMEMAGITGTYEQTGVQSTRAFTPPFTITMTSSMGGGVTLSDAQGGSGIGFGGGVGGIPEWTGFWYTGPTGPGTYWDQRGKLSNTAPSTGIFYTVSIAVTSAGTAMMSVHTGSALLGQGSLHVGLGPFYLLLGIGDGAHYSGSGGYTFQSIQVMTSQTPTPTS